MYHLRVSKIAYPGILFRKMTSMHYVFVCSLLTTTILSCTGERPQPTHQPSTKADTTVTVSTVPSFSGDRAFSHLLKQVSFGPRNPNSQGHQACLDFLYAELKELGDQVKLQPFVHVGYENERLNLTNVVASFNVSSSTRILLCAHWDTRPRAEQDANRARRNEPIIGANDAASGAAVLLELASILKQHPPSIGVDLAFFDGEDYGHEGDVANYLLGSRHFAMTKPQDYLPRFGILLDMIGDAFLEIQKEQHSLKYAPDIVDLVWQKARQLGYPQFVDAVGEAVTDDHLPLNEVGIKTIDLIDFNYPDPTNRYWHTHQDTPDKCSPESLEAVGTVLTHLIYTQHP